MPICGGGGSIEVLPFTVAVHMLLYPNKAEEVDRISFSCRFKSGQEHQFFLTRHPTFHSESVITDSQSFTIKVETGR